MDHYEEEDPPSPSSSAVPVLKIRSWNQQLLQSARRGNLEKVKEALEAGSYVIIHIRETI